MTEFAVVLTAYNTDKISMVKAVRSATGLGLKEAKDLVETLPAAIKTGISMIVAARLRFELEVAGGIVEIREEE